ncbi:DUF4144 domain-containing protein [Vibrio ostreicida]|uniref:DUF4144 domain-containing protein n=2 Tax=Vibrio ostreicida TaxID=526588 RepID=UPI001FEB1629|nr:DUF4144 domain-containing protein [Vibrio ostreicida]
MSIPKFTPYVVDDGQPGMLMVCPHRNRHVTQRYVNEEKMIQWPCILKLDGDTELMFFACERQLTAELEALIWGADDRLVDSNGCPYAITSVSGGYTFEPLGPPLSLEAVTQFIQEHEFAKAEVCLTKIQFPSIQVAIGSLALEK